MQRNTEIYDFRNLTKNTCSAMSSLGRNDPVKLECTAQTKRSVGLLSVCLMHSFFFRTIRECERNGEVPLLCLSLPSIRISFLNFVCFASKSSKNYNNYHDWKAELRKVPINNTRLQFFCFLSLNNWFLWIFNVEYENDLNLLPSR